MPEEPAGTDVELPDARKLLLTEAGVTEEAGVTPLSLSILSNALSNFIILCLSMVLVDTLVDMLVGVVVVVLNEVVARKSPALARRDCPRNAAQ